MERWWNNVDRKKVSNFYKVLSMCHFTYDKFHIVLGVTHFSDKFSTLLLVIIILLPEQYTQNSLENKKRVILDLSGIGPNRY